MLANRFPSQSKKTVELKKKWTLYISISLHVKWFNYWKPLILLPNKSEKHYASLEKI